MSQAGPPTRRSRSAPSDEVVTLKRRLRARRRRLWLTVAVIIAIPVGYLAVISWNANRTTFVLCTVESISFEPESDDGAAAYRIESSGCDDLYVAASSATLERVTIAHCFSTHLAPGGSYFFETYKPDYPFAPKRQEVLQILKNLASEGAQCEPDAYIRLKLTE